MKLNKYLPFTQWLFRYDKENLTGDITAGLTVAVMLIPQAMAYAMLAGLPPIIGLYASVIPLLIYALFGSSRQLAVGPVAMVSLLVAAGVGKLTAAGSNEYIMYAVVLALMIGVIQLIMGVARLGFIVNFFSHPVISGFTSAAALIIGFSQLKNLLGMSIPRSHHIHTIIWNAVSQISQTHLATLAIGAASILVLILLKKWKPAFPGALTVVILGTITVSIFNLDQAGVKIVGDVPQGLPALAFPVFNWEVFKSLLPMALAISFVGFMESISVAKALASKYRYTVDANQELIGLGMANIAGSLFSAYPVTGGFSRTAVNAQAGAKTGLASIFTALMIAVTLLFLTPLFHNLPVAVLAAIIMVAVFGLIDYPELRHLWKIKKSDAAMLLITFFATLTMGIEVGILTGVGISLLAFVVRTTRPHYALLGRLPGSDSYRNVKNFPEAEKVDNTVILRIDASFYFGNVNFLKEKIDQIFADNPETKTLILDASSINYMDASAETALQEIYRDLSVRNIQLKIANIKGPVRNLLTKSGFYEIIGAKNFYFSVRDAVWSIQENISGEPKKYRSEYFLQN